MGTRQLITVDTTAGRLRVRAPNTLRVSDGETVGLDFETEKPGGVRPRQRQGAVSAYAELMAGGAHG